MIVDGGLSTRSNGEGPPSRAPPFQTCMRSHQRTGSYCSFLTTSFLVADLHSMIGVASSDDDDRWEGCCCCAVVVAGGPPGRAETSEYLTGVVKVVVMLGEVAVGVEASPIRGYPHPFQFALYLDSASLFSCILIACFETISSPVMRKTQYDNIMTPEGWSVSYMGI